MTVMNAPLTEITQSAIHMLCREIRIVHTVRFLNQFSMGYGNDAEERDVLSGDKSVQEIVAEIKSQN